MIWSAFHVTEEIRIDTFYSFFDPHYKEGYSFAGEAHNFWECLYVCEGSLRVSSDDRVYNLTREQIIFHKPLELHKFHVDHKDGATLLIFSFSMEGALTEHLKDKVFLLSEPQQKIMHALLDYLHTTLAGCKTTSDIPEYKYLYHDRATKLYYQMLTTYVNQLILSLIDNGTISEASTAPDAQIFSQAVNYINNRVHLSASIPEIAEECYVSVSTLKRIFQKYAGISIHKYILTMKTKAATELLKNGMSVTKVGKTLGFSSQAYFSACYKRETGISPSDFVKTLKENVSLR